MNLARSFWLGVAEAYLEPSQTSTKGRFYEKVFAKSSIVDVQLGCKYAST